MQFCDFKKVKFLYLMLIQYCAQLFIGVPTLLVMFICKFGQGTYVNRSKKNMFLPKTDPYICTYR